MLDNEGRPVNPDLMAGYLYNQHLMAGQEENKSDDSSEITGDKSPCSSPGRTFAFKNILIY